MQKHGIHARGKRRFRIATTENDWPAPPTFLRLDHRRRATYGADHLQEVYPYLCSPQSLAKNSLHYLLKCSSPMQFEQDWMDATVKIAA
jgi:hypothetical protein